ncbi:unnamed protein product [Gongylonema pulchrum]|uniref:Ovule protein n=1 Tax=Gongylonema pulchrum TaxID=637853 RepID=A0A183ES25_9BILA|nr:unnamed protein product [Gongylonema pulchrum]
MSEQNQALLNPKMATVLTSKYSLRIWIQRIRHMKFTFRRNALISFQNTCTLTGLNFLMTQNDQEISCVKLNCLCEIVLQLQPSMRNYMILLK